MNNSAAKVGEIFREAGTAFNKLSEMALMLQPTDDSPPGGKWSDAEVEMLRGCINRFAVELNKISQHIKNRTMRHLKCLFEMESGKIQDISSSPQHLTQQPHPAQEHKLETESQCDLNETFVNIFSQGFPEQVKDEDIDQFLRHFDPNVVSSTPPIDFMQDDRSRQHSAFEFEDFQDSSYDITLQAVPSLISLLDADVNNANYSERKKSTESSMANIGTLHAELPNFGCDLGEATGASSNFQDLNFNYTSSVSREAHFSLRQAQDTWKHVSSPATNQTMVVPFKGEGDIIFYTRPNGQTTRVQVSHETALIEKKSVNESQYRPHDTVSGLLSQKTLWPGSFNNYSLPNNPFRSAQTPKYNLMEDHKDTQKKIIEKPRNILYPGFIKSHSLFGNLLASNFKKTMPQEKPRDNIICPGSFSSLNNDPFGSVQAPNEKLEKGGSTNMININKTMPQEKFRNNIIFPGSFSSLNNDPFGSVQAPNEKLEKGGSTNMININKTMPQERFRNNIIFPGSFSSLNNDPFGSVQAPNEKLEKGGSTNMININKTMPQEKFRNNIIFPGSFSSLNNDPFGSVQAPNEKLEKCGSTNMISCTNLFGNSLYSANPEPVINFSSIRADKQALASGAHLTCARKGRGRSRRRRECPATRESADECTAEQRMTRMRSRHEYYYEIEKPDKKCSRKKATTKTTANSRTKAQKNKQ